MVEWASYKKLALLFSRLYFNHEYIRHSGRDGEGINYMNPVTSFSNNIQDRAVAQSMAVLQDYTENKQSYKDMAKLKDEQLKISITHKAAELFNNIVYKRVVKDPNGNLTTADTVCTVTAAELKAMTDRVTSYVYKASAERVRESGINLKKDASIVKALKELKRSAFMLQANDIPRYIYTLIDFNKYIKTLDSRYQKNIWVWSDNKGNGKSTHQTHVMDAYKALDIPNASGAFPTKDIHSTAGTTFQENRVVAVKDASYDTVKNMSIDKFKAIGRHESFSFRPAFGTEDIAINPIAGVFVCANAPVPDRNDRAFEAFETIAVKVNEPGFLKAFPELRDTNNEDIDLTDLVSITDTKIQAKLQDFIAENIEETKTVNVNGLDTDTLSALRHVADLDDLVEMLKSTANVKINSDVKGYIQLKDIPEMKENPGKLHAMATCLRDLAGLGFVKAAGATNPLYRKWDVSRLLTLDLDVTYTAQAFESELDKVKKNQEMFDKLIAYFESEAESEAKKDTTTELPEFTAETIYDPVFDNILMTPEDIAREERILAEYEKEHRYNEPDNIPPEMPLKETEDKPIDLSVNNFSSCTSADDYLALFGGLE